MNGARKSVSTQLKITAKQARLPQLTKKDQITNSRKTTEILFSRNRIGKHHPKHKQATENLEKLQTTVI